MRAFGQGSWRIILIYSQFCYSFMVCPFLFQIQITTTWSSVGFILDTTSFLRHPTCKLLQGKNGLKFMWMCLNRTHRVSCGHWLEIFRRSSRCYSFLEVLFWSFLIVKDVHYMTISVAQWYYLTKIDLISPSERSSFQLSFIFQVKF